MNTEKENTFRALKDEALLVTSVLCRFNWHRWEQWSVPYIPKNGNSNVQHRYCACCNKMSIRRLRDDKGQAV